jgi:hypothetical protein
VSLLLLFKGAGGGGTPQSTTFPDLVVQFGFDAGPSTPLASTSWTNIPLSYIRGISTNRGRSVETDDFQAGTCDLVLSNAARTFDPDYTSGPYYGKLLPLRRVRVLANYAGTTYPLFNGFTPDEWPQEYDGSNHDSTVTLRCVDGFFVLNQKAVSLSPFQRIADPIAATIGATELLRWRLGEKFGTVARDSGSETNGYDGTYAGFAAALPSTSGLSAFDDDTGMQFNGAQSVEISPPARGTTRASRRGRLRAGSARPTSDSVLWDGIDILDGAASGLYREQLSLVAGSCRTATQTARGTRTRPRSTTATPITSSGTTRHRRQRSASSSTAFRRHRVVPCRHLYHRLRFSVLPARVQHRALVVLHRHD